MGAQKKLNLTGILIQDPKVGGFTAFLAGMPEVIAEGDNEEEAMVNLFEAFSTIMNLKVEEALNGTEGIITKSMELEIS